MRKTYKAVQQPLLSEPTGKLIMLYLHDLVSPEDIDADWPDTDLVQDIAEKWLTDPIKVCPHSGGRYYPYDGRRRVLALYLMQEWGWKFDGKEPRDIAILAVLREDLTPETARRLAFQANNLRSANPITDVDGVRYAAEKLGVDPMTRSGVNEIARYLRVKPAQVMKIAKGLRLDHEVYSAFKEGRISEQTLAAIRDLKDEKARTEIAKRLGDGDILTRSEVHKYSQVTVNKALQEASTSRPSFDFGQVDSDPLSEAIEILENYLMDNKGRENNPDIAKALDCLNQLR